MPLDMDEDAKLIFLQTANISVEDFLKTNINLSIKAELLGYPPIRANYWAEIYDSVEQYLTGNKPVTSFRNKASIAVSEAFTDAVYEGYAQAGAELPLPDDIQAWLSQRIAEERTHIEGMFDRLKAEWEGLDWIKEAYARADSYSRTLDAMYGEAKLRGSKNQMVSWILGSTEEHCETCSTLAGKKHRISYLIAHDYIPRKPDCGLSCHGYRCDCKIVDSRGQEITI